MASTSLASAAATASLAASAAVSPSASDAPGLNLSQNNQTFSIVGIILAVASGLFIGVSFVVKKKGLIAATRKYGNTAGEGHAYLKSWLWWTGMVLMIVGEILNFVAYAFTVAILVAPMGSVSVVVAAILSHFFLKESLTFFGWIGCTLCILGSIILALNAPHGQSVRTIREFLQYFKAPGFLVWMSLMFVVALVIVFYVAPRWGRKTMMPYISVCSLVGGISVSCTQGLGASIVTSIELKTADEVKFWFFWFLLVFVVVTLLIEINYLNKALELFNTSMVVPVYFCYFTSATMVTSFILYRGLKASAVALVTMVLGFLVICLGITLLQMSKVDPKSLKGLDRRSTILLQASRHKTEADERGDITAAEEPGMDALRGGFGAVGSIIRARSIQRRMSAASRGSAGSSSAVGSRAPYGHHPQMNTGGLDHLPRYQLSDRPVSDDTEHIALRSPEQPYPQSGPPRVPTPKRSGSTLKFADDNIVHQYGYTQQDGQTAATHTVVAHDDLHDDSTTGEPRPSSSRGSEKAYAEPYGDEWQQQRQQQQQDSKTNFTQLLGTLMHQPPAPSPWSPSATHGFPINFPVPGRSGDREHGGGGRKRTTSRDYPHLGKKDRDLDREERAKLVESPEQSDNEDDEHAPAGGDLGSPPTLTLPPFTSPFGQSGSGNGPPPRREDSPRRPMGPR